MPRPSTLLPTTVVGSYSVPEWLERLKDDFYQRRISSEYLREIHEVAIKAAVKDQEGAGVDILSDGELRRDNDIDYLLARIPGVEIVGPVKQSYFDYFTARVAHPLPDPGSMPLGVADDFLYVREQTDHAVKVSLTGPYSLSRRIENEAYRDRSDLVFALAECLNGEAQRLADAGAEILQLDEPFLAGYPSDVHLAIEAVNVVTKDVPVDWSLHVCYGNRYARPSWEGHYDFLFPSVLDAHVNELMLECARKGYDDLQLFERYDWDRRLGLGVIDVKTTRVETAAEVADRIQRGLTVMPASRLVVSPDCGLRHVPVATAREKLRAMVQGAASVRSQITDGNAQQTDAERVGA
jgi:5-methyltetrahydropteroyltriglutamate--homocysteine methyltransferase